MPTLFPYTTLFRSRPRLAASRDRFNGQLPGPDLRRRLDCIEYRSQVAGIQAARAAAGGPGRARRVWITADIYLRGPRDPRIGQDDRLRDFLAAHRVEEQKFESRAAAEAFFAEAGFAIRHRRARSDDATRESWVVAPS